MLTSVKPQNAWGVMHMQAFSVIIALAFVVTIFSLIFPNVLPSSFAFTNGQNASLVIGQTNFTSYNFFGTTANTLQNPSTSTFDSSGNLWVADYQNHRILKFTTPFSTGQSASLVIGQTGFTSGSSGTTVSTLTAPIGLTFDSSGNLWVSDIGNNRILKFTTPFSTGQSASLVIGQTGFTSSSSGTTASTFDGPVGLTFDSSGNLWVSDIVNSRILKFTTPFSTGQSASLVIGQTGFTSGSSGTTASTLNFPRDLTFDSSGNLWVSDGDNHRILKFTTPFSTGQSASLVIGQTGFTSSSSGTTASTLTVPIGLTFDSSGNLWVVDYSNNRILNFTTPFSTGQSASLVIGQTDFTSGNSNTTVATLYSPTGLTFDYFGNLWITDQNNHRVLKFNGPDHEPVANNDKATTPENTFVTIPVLSNDTDVDGNQISISSFTNGTHGKVTSIHTYLSQFGSFGSGNSQFSSPFGVGTDSSRNIYVADSDNNRVEKFNSTGTYLSQFGTSGSGNGQFNATAGIALDSLGNIYVVDTNNNRIQKFNSAGTYQSQFGSYGSGNGQFNSPYGLVIDSSGNIYVTDIGNSRVQKFNSAGTYQSQFGSYGSGNGQFIYPRGIALDTYGNIYVADTNNNRIQKFNSAGVYLSQFGSSGSGNGQFDIPYDIFIDSSDHIYVADSGNNRTQIFNSVGNYLSQFGSSGFGNGQFNTPTGITIDNADNVYVVDHYNNRVEKFRDDLKYVPNSGFTGLDSFTYTISDGHGATSSATVNVIAFLSLTNSIGITDKISYVFTSTSIVGSGGTAKTTLPGGTTAAITLPVGQSGTVTIQTTTAPTTGSGGTTLSFVGTVIDITPPTNSCSAGCVFSFNFTSAQVTAAGLTNQSQVVIYHDHNNDGDFNDPGETLSTTITTVSPGNFIATATDFFTSKFAIGGVIAVQAILGVGGNSGSSQAFSAQGFTALRTLSQSAKDAIQNEDPYVPLKPSNDTTVPYYPFSLDGNNYLIARYANTIQTVTEKVGVPVNLQLASYDTTISHIALYTNMEGLSKEIGDSDTYVIYDKGSPLQLVDPHGYFSNVKITTTTDSNNIEKFVFTMTFAKPMPTSNIFIREWDEVKYSSDTKIKDAIQIVESPPNTQTLKDVLPDKLTSHISSEQSNILVQSAADDVTNYVKQWAGYSQTSISDSELLDHFGIKGEHIPSWFMKTGKWMVNGDASQQEFKEAIHYMSDKGIIK